MWFPVFLVPLCHHVIWNLAGSHFQIFSPLGEINHFWNKKAFFRWFHVVPGVFCSIMLKCYKEFRWFPFQIFSLLSEINHFWNKSEFFLDGSMWFPGFWFFLLTCHMEPCLFPFSNFKPAWWNKSLMGQKCKF